MQRVHAYDIEKMNIDKIDGAIRLISNVKVPEHSQILNGWVISTEDATSCMFAPSQGHSERLKTPRGSCVVFPLRLVFPSCRGFVFSCWDKHLELDGKKFRTGSALLFIENKDYSHPYMWMTLHWLEDSRMWGPCGRNWWKMLIWETRHHFLTTCTWDALNVNANRTRISLRNIQRCSNHIFLLEQRKNDWDGRNFTEHRLRGPTTWTDKNMENLL